MAKKNYLGNRESSLLHQVALLASLKQKKQALTIYSLQGTKMLL